MSPVLGQNGKGMTERRSQFAENRAKVVLAEAEVLKAISGAFRSGNLGMMDG
jgi:uncharacterized protein YqfA (UPF0365 family)